MRKQLGGERYLEPQSKLQHPGPTATEEHALEAGDRPAWALQLHSGCSAVPESAVAQEYIHCRPARSIWLRRQQPHCRLPSYGEEARSQVSPGRVGADDAQRDRRAAGQIDPEMSGGPESVVAATLQAPVCELEPELGASNRLTAGEGDLTRSQSEKERCDTPVQDALLLRGLVMPANGARINCADFLAWHNPAVLPPEAPSAACALSGTGPLAILIPLRTILFELT
jgi:hypothetical protein